MQGFSPLRRRKPDWLELQKYRDVDGSGKCGKRLKSQATTAGTAGPQSSLQNMPQCHIDYCELKLLAKKVV